MLTTLWSLLGSWLWYTDHMRHSKLMQQGIQLGHTNASFPLRGWGWHSSHSCRGVVHGPSDGRCGVFRLGEVAGCIGCQTMVSWPSRHCDPTPQKKGLGGAQLPAPWWCLSLLNQFWKVQLCDFLTSCHKKLTSCCCCRCTMRTKTRVVPNWPTVAPLVFLHWMQGEKDVVLW